MAFSFPWFINGNRVSMATRRSCIVCAASICTFIITCIICIFGSPTISANDSMRMITSWICSSIMPMCRQFSDRLLYCSTPTINRYIRLQVIVRIIRASVTNSYGMSMCTSLFGCFCALIRTPWSRSRFCTTRVVFFYKSKSMRVIPACTNRYIVVMGRQFSDSFMRYVST